MNIRQVLVQSISQLKAAKSSFSTQFNTPELDVELLLAEALGQDRDYLLINTRDSVSGSQLEIFNQFLARRLAHEPIAYILGKKEFWGLEFKVTPAVLIPRPDTEILVEQAILAARELIKNKEVSEIKILELGTGSGCIAISLASELDKLKINYSMIAVDKSFEALRIAKENRATLLSTDRISFLQSDWFDSIPQQKFNFILSNPPYVNPAMELQPELEFEPEMALYSEDRGLLDIKKIMESSINYSTKHSQLIIEFGAEQAGAIDLFSSELGYSNKQIKDLAGLSRVAILSRL